MQQQTVTFRLLVWSSRIWPKHTDRHTSNSVLHRVTLQSPVKSTIISSLNILLSTYHLQFTAVYCCTSFSCWRTILLFLTTRRLYSVEWSCRWIVLKETFLLIHMISAVMTSLSLLTIVNNYLRNTCFLAPSSVIFLCSSQYCRLSSHPVSRSFLQKLWKSTFRLCY